MSAALRTQVAIVGAGPAGMAAAHVLVARGVEVLLLDEGQQPGGQIFRQLPRQFRGLTPYRYVPPSHEQGHALLTMLQTSRVRVRCGVTVFDAQPRQLWFEEEGRAHQVQADHILLATGAYDRSLPFPGWTLPGVVTAGAAQVLVRGHMVRPGSRAVVAGTGPLLLPTVTALLGAGVQVSMLLEANRFSQLLRGFKGVVANRSRRRETMHYAHLLLRHRVWMRTGWAVLAAHGQGRLQSCVVGRVDHEGRPEGGTEREVKVDLLCVGFGLLPATELAVRVGCDMHHHDARGGWLPHHDDNLQTSVPGVWVAGEICGIGGADVATAEGELAGLAIAGKLGRAGPDLQADLSRASRRRGRGRQQADAMLAAFPVLPGLYDLAADETIVCRCEDVTHRQVRQAARLCGADIRSVKMATRAGMGPCQARVCHAIIGGLLECRLGGHESPTPCASVQMPVKPVSVGSVLDRSRS
ncbi:MAG: FAD/NAD(P)-dependent oxidoreductase [Planctomycetota bacterium]